MHTPPGLAINVAVFAILFPLLTRLVARKWIGWIPWLMAVVVYIAVGLLIDWSGLLNRLPF